MKPVFLLAAAMALSPQPLLAQPADLPVPAAKTNEYPPGIAVRQTRSGPVYANARGRTLYGMDMRTVLRWSPDASQFCKDRCAEWEPLLAPTDAKPNIAFPRGLGGPPAPRVAGASSASASRRRAHRRLAQIHHLGRLRRRNQDGPPKNDVGTLHGRSSNGAHVDDQRRSTREDRALPAWIVG